ncbi:MAG: hypothetical protein SO013_02850 [Prevotella sp.]|nr:hypothetical protein [Prevotella sp.]
MKSIAKYSEVEKIISANNKIFIKGKEFYSDEIIFVSKNFELFNSDNIIYRYIDKNLEIFNYNKGVFIEIYNNSNHIIQSSTDNNLSLIFDNSSDDTIVYDLQNHTTINTYDFGKDISIYYHNLVIVTEGFSYTNKNKVSCWDLDKSNNLWSYTLPEGFTIFGQVQVIDNLLILYAVDNNFDHSKTIALDINSGNMKWELDNTIFCQVDTKKKLLLGYAIRRYEVIDPFLGEKIVQKNMMDYYEKGLSPVSPNNTIANGKLWFVSGRGENVKFGRINIETSEVDFIQDFPLQNDGQLSKPVFHNGNLYLLDSNNTLHIFEE